jgi:signal transduction histidine kinase
MKQTNKLLEVREAQGLQVTFVARLLLVALFTPLDFIAMAGSPTINVWLYVPVLVLLVGVYLVCLLALRHQRAVGAVGVLGVALDLCMLASGTLIQLQIAEAGGASAVHVLNSGQPLAGTIFIMLNGLALRPRYPLLVTAGALAALLVVLTLALLDPRTTFSEQFLNMLPRPGELNSGLVLMQVGVLMTTGAIMVYITWAARRTVREAVRLEQVNTAMAESQTEAVIEAKTTALTGLVAGISHEMNNPVGAVSSTAETTARSVEVVRQVLAEAEDLAAARQSQRLRRALAVLERNSEVVREAVGRLSGTTDTLKRFTRLDESERQLVDLSEGIESALGLLRHQLGEGITIRRHFEQPPRVHGHPGRLNQLFYTLLKNAAESIEGRGVITVSAGGAAGGGARVVIEDTGRGMAAKRLDQLFDVQFSADASRIHAGMGLPTCRSIVRRHGGSITVRSMPGEGTAFTIELPAAGGPKAADR